MLDLVDPPYEHIGAVYGVETEEGYEWHSILVDENFVLKLEEDKIVSTIPYSGEIYRMTFSPDYRYLVGYCYLEKLLLFDLEEEVVSEIPLFSRDMELPGNPLIRVFNNGSVLVKHSTYARIYDSNLNVILSRDEFHWEGSFTGILPDGSMLYVESDDSLKAYSHDLDLLWMVDLPIYRSSDGFYRTNVRLSDSGRIVTVISPGHVFLLSSTDGHIIDSTEITEGILSFPILSISDRYFAFGTFTDPQTTPMNPSPSLGVRVYNLESNLSDQDFILRIPYTGDSYMPYFLSAESVSDQGYTLGSLLYTDPTFIRIVLISPEMDIVWLSDRLFHYHNRFIGPLCAFTTDGGGFWYYDGESIWSCLIEVTL